MTKACAPLAAPPLTAALDAMIAAARAGAEAALRYYRPGGKTTAEIEMKPGNSPVTAADHAANRAIMARLAGAFETIDVISEEGAPGAGWALPFAFVIDPIDGTRAFMTGRDDWCVSIGLVSAERALAGVVLAPARTSLLFGAEGLGAFRNDAALPSPVMREGPRILGPMPVAEPLAAALGGTVSPPVRALAYRLAKVAEGEAEIALAGAGSNLWDIAGAAAILTAGGARLVTPRGQAPRFELRPMPPLIALAGGMDDRLPAAARWREIIGSAQG